MEKVKVGVIGAGNLGLIHAKNLQFRIPNATVIAVSATTEEKVKRLQEELEVPYGYTDYRELVKNEELDAVIIASSTAVHYDHAMAAIEAGLHVFIEKPTGINVEECQKIEAAANASDKFFTVGFMRRYDPSYAEAKRRIDAGEIGTPILYRGYSLDPVWVAEYLAERADKNGCWFLDMGVHDYDLARWFLGSEAKSAVACGGAYSFPVFDKTNDVDNGYTLVNFENKSAAFIYVGRTAAHGTHVEGEVIGTKGSIRICADSKVDHIQQYTSEGVLTKAYQSYPQRWEQAFCIELQAFVDSIQSGVQQGPTAHDGTMATTMGITVQSAYVSGELVKF